MGSSPYHPRRGTSSPGAAARPQTAASSVSCTWPRWPYSHPSRHSWWRRLPRPIIPRRPRTSPGNACRSWVSCASIPWSSTSWTTCTYVSQPATTITRIRTTTTAWWWRRVHDRPEACNVTYLWTTDRERYKQPWTRDVRSTSRRRSTITPCIPRTSTTSGWLPDAYWRLPSPWGTACYGVPWSSAACNGTACTTNEEDVRNVTVWHLFNT